MAAPRGLALVLLAVSAMSASFLPARAQCPDYKSSNGCMSCVSGGLTGNFTIPKLPPTCALANCNYTGVVVMGEQRVQVQPEESPFSCCRACKKKQACKIWQWIPSRNRGVCFLYPGPAGPSCGEYPSHVGTKCVSVRDDPHFEGAHGTRYDFSGVPDKTFCLVSDLRLHINMKMTGYMDTRTESATVLYNGKALRTWIRELGILWMAEGGVQHSLLLVARSGKETARGRKGFLAMAEVDGNTLPSMEVGEEASLPGGLNLKFSGIKKKGVFEVDCYSVRIEGLLEISLELRVAHPLLQRPDDAETHISAEICWLKTTPAVHGVLGQTYREGREERNIEFTKLSEDLHRAIVADGREWRGFLDGVPEDYVSSDVLQPDCRYSGFSGRNMPTTAE